MAGTHRGYSTLSIAALGLLLLSGCGGEPSVAGPTPEQTDTAQPDASTTAEAAESSAPVPVRADAPCSDYDYSSVYELTPGLDSEVIVVEEQPMVIWGCRIEYDDEHEDRILEDPETYTVGISGLTVIAENPDPETRETVLGFGRQVVTPSGRTVQITTTDYDVYFKSNAFTETTDGQWVTITGAFYSSDVPGEEAVEEALLGVADTL